MMKYFRNFTCRLIREAAKLLPTLNRSIFQLRISRWNRNSENSSFFETKKDYRRPTKTTYLLKPYVSPDSRDEESACDWIVQSLNEQSLDEDEKFPRYRELRRVTMVLRWWCTFWNLTCRLIRETEDPLPIKSVNFQKRNSKLKKDEISKVARSVRNSTRNHSAVFLSSRTKVPPLVYPAPSSSPEH